MKKVRLTMKYEEQYKVIKELVDHGGNKKRAALILGISVRQLNRRISQYRSKGKAAFVHGNTGHLPTTSFRPNLGDRQSGKWPKRSGIGITQNRLPKFLKWLSIIK